MSNRQLLALLGIALVVSGGCAPRRASEPIWIGHLAPLSGSDRFAGEQANHAIQLFINHAISQDQRVLGRQLAVLHVDCGEDLDTVRAESVRLLSVNRVVALIGSLDAAQAERLSREAHPYGATVVLTGEVVGPAHSENVLCLGVESAARGRVLAHLASERRLDRVAVVCDGRSVLYGNLVSAFGREMRARQKTTLHEWSFETEKDNTEWIEEAIKWQPKALLLACSPRVFLRSGQALRQAGFKGPLLYGGEDVGSERLQSNSGEGETYLATICCLEGLTNQGVELAGKYEHQFQEKPGFAALQAYDAMRLLAEILQEVPPGTMRLREALIRPKNFESLTGMVFFQERRTQRKLFLMELKGHSSQLIQTIESEGD